MVDDAELLRQYAREGSDAAFTVLVNRYLNLVYSVALRKLGGDVHRAEDVSQQVFARLAQRASSLAGCQVLSGWLYTVSHNLAGSVMRDEFRRRRREGLAMEAQELMNTPDSPADWLRLKPVLDDAMHELGRGDREAVLLRFFEGQTYGEIAQRLRISENGARMRVERALDKLNGVLSRHGIGSTAAALGAVLSAQSVTAAPPALAAAISAAGIVGAGGAALPGISLIMSTSKTTVGILAAIAIGSIGTTLYEFREAGRARADLTALAKERDGMARRIQEDEKQRNQLQDRVAALNAAASAKPVQQPSRAAGSLNQGIFRMNSPELAALMRNPDYRKLQAETLRGQVDSRYAGLFKTLALPADQLAQFKSLLVEKMLSSTDAAEAARDQGLGPGALFQAVRDAANAADDEIKATLGDSLYAQYQQYEQTLPERNLATQLQQSLSYTSTPLTDDQASQLIQVLQQDSPQTRRSSMTIQNANGAISVGNNTNAALISDKSVAMAQSFLAPSQVQALQQIQAQQNAQQQMAQMMRSASQGGGGGVGGIVVTPAR